MSTPSEPPESGQDAWTRDQMQKIASLVNEELPDIFIGLLTGQKSKRTTEEQFQAVTGWQMERVRKAFAEAHLAGLIAP